MEEQHKTFSLEQSTSIVFQGVNHDTEEEAIAKQLEQHVSDCVEAVNARQFDPNAAPWHLMSDDFQMTTNGATLSTSKDKADTLDQFRMLTTAYPTFRLTMEAFDAHVNQKSRYAKVYVNGRATGGPSTPHGLSRTHVYLFEHRLVGKEWQLVKQTSIMGIGEL